MSDTIRESTLPGSGAAPTTDGCGADSAASKRLPDFIIAGAMKCATTSLHQMMNSHPDVYIPPGEVLYFSIDDCEHLPDTFYRGKDRWAFRDFDADSDLLSPWYASKFADGRNARHVGEDSPTYLATEAAPARMARMLPDARLIFMLRDPVRRAYSHYWHNVVTGRAFFDFDTTIRYCPGIILKRGEYLAGLRRFLQHFPRNQIKVVLFEDFVAAPINVTREVLEFVGSDPKLLPETVKTHFNRTRIPRNLPLWLLRNRLTRELIGERYVGFAPGMPEPRIPPGSARMIRRILDRINRLTDARPQAMSDDTRSFLVRYYQKANRGLGTLIGADLDRAWGG